MKKLGTREFLFEVFSLILIAILVQAVYATYVRPRAEQIRLYDEAQMKKDPNYVPARTLEVIVKDPEQEIEIIFAV